MDSTNLLGNGWSTYPKHRAKLLEHLNKAIASNDLDAMYKLATYCGYSFSQYDYYEGYVCEPATFVRGFNEVLKYQYALQVFEAVEAEKGKAFIDRNAKYF